MAQSPITLLEEIQQQPMLFQQILAGYPGLFVPEKPFPLNVQALFGIAEGSSKHALEIAAPFLENWLGIPVWVSDPETFEEKLTLAGFFKTGVEPIFKQAYFVAVSQSGETASTLKLLAQLIDAFPNTQTGCFPLLSVTNKTPSTLATRYGNNLLIGAGEEHSIAATKTLTLSVLALLLWGLNAAQEQKTLNPEQTHAIHQQLNQIPPKLQALWEGPRLSALLSFTRKLIEVNHFLLLSKGPLNLILPEIGLKLTETSSNIVYTNNTESFRHGPKVILSGVNGQHPNSIYFVPTDARLAEALFKDVQSHFWTEDRLMYENDRVFFVLFENSPPIPDTIIEGLAITPDRVLVLPAASLFESLFIGLVAFQTISYYLAMIKGENPNNPALEKAVTQ